MVVVAVEGRVRTVMVALRIHRGLAGRLSGSHAVDALLEMERQLVLMGNLRDDVSWVARRHGLSREGGHLKELCVGKVHGRLRLLVVSRLSPRRLCIVGRLQAACRIPLLLRYGLDCLDVVQSIELGAEGRSLRFHDGLSLKEGAGGCGSRLLIRRQSDRRSRARSAATVAIGAERRSMRARPKFAAVGIQPGALCACDSAGTA